MNFFQVYPFHSRYINLDLVKEIVFTNERDNETIPNQQVKIRFLGEEKLDEPWTEYWLTDEQVSELEERLKERLK